MPNNDPLQKWENTVQDQAQHDNNLFQQSHDDVASTLEQNKNEIKRNIETQENNANDYSSDDTYTDR